MRNTKIGRWLYRLGLGLLGLLVLFLLFTFIYARIQDQRALKGSAEGSLLVDIGGRHIHMRALGLEHDGPAVVLLPCFTCASDVWQAVQPELAKTTRVYAYDLAGFAWSDPPPEPLTPTRIADDLQAVLTELGEDEVILVGFSGGAISVYNYFNRYPHDPEVVGLVWSEGDALTPSELAYYNGEFLPIPRFLQHALIELGVWRLIVDAFFPDTDALRASLPEPNRSLVDWDYVEAVSATSGTRRAAHAMLDMVVAFPEDVQRTAELPMPESVPVFVLDADYGPDFAELEDPGEIAKLRQLEAERAEWYQALAEKAPDGRYIPVADSSHMVVLDQPQAVIDAIADLTKLVNR